MGVLKPSPKEAHFVLGASWQKVDFGCGFAVRVFLYQCVIYLFVVSV